MRSIVRVDFDVSLNPDHGIADDTRIRSNIPTLKHLLESGNKVICIAKLGRPKGRDKAFSLKVVVDQLPKYLPGYKFTLVDDFLTQPELFENQTPNEVLVLENIRFYPEEKQNDPEFAKKLASLGDVFIMDAFAMAHRNEASVTGIPKYLPSYPGMLFEKEVRIIRQAIENPTRPLVTLVGGAKISTKMGLIDKLTHISDHVLVGGALANTLIAAQGFEIGTSLVEAEYVDQAKKVLEKCNLRNSSIPRTTTNTQTSPSTTPPTSQCNLHLPTDVIVENAQGEVRTTSVSDIKADESIYDIGPETIKTYTDVINLAKTIIWNGPMGYFEKDAYKKGSESIFAAVRDNENAQAIIGGGDTLTAIGKLPGLDRIFHVSTGGGAMLELIDKGTLPAIEALK